MGAAGTMMVHSENTGHAMRRSTRVPAQLAVRVRSLDPGFQFEEECRTLLVNAQGCGFQCSRQIPVGIAIRFTIDGRQATATILNATASRRSPTRWSYRREAAPERKFLGTCLTSGRLGPTSAGADRGSDKQRLHRPIHRRKSRLRDPPAVGAGNGWAPHPVVEVAE